MKATYSSLTNWYKKMFEKLGFMILAYNKGHDDLINNYINNLYLLKDSLMEALVEINDPDRKRDLKIMLDNLKILIEHVTEDFSEIS